MSLAPDTLRARIEARITSALGSASPPWRVATLGYDQFPGADLSDREALSFAVGLPSTVFLDEGRQRVGGQHMARTTVGVKFTSYLRTDAHVSDYDLALQREAALVAAVRATVGDGGPAARVVQIERAVVGDGTTFLAGILFECAHGYPL